MQMPPSRFLSDLPEAAPVALAETPPPQSTPVHCRPGCGACCIAPSISSAIPGMPHGKPAGMRCIQLDAANGCMIFNDPRRPAVCASLAPSSEMCGDNRRQAMHYLQELERLTG